MTPEDLERLYDDHKAWAAEARRDGNLPKAAWWSREADRILADLEAYR